MLAREASRGQLVSEGMHTQHNNTDSVWFTDPPDLKMTLSEVVAVKVLSLHRHDGGQTLEAQLNFGFTDRSGGGASKRQLVLSLLIPFSCIDARRHRVWSRAFIHEGSSFLTRKKTF